MKEPSHIVDFWDNEKRHEREWKYDYSLCKYKNDYLFSIGGTN